MGYYHFHWPVEIVMKLTVMLSAQNKTCVQTLEGHAQNISCVAFHPELPIILTGSEDGTYGRSFWLIIIIYNHKICLLTLKKWPAANNMYIKTMNKRHEWTDGFWDVFWKWLCLWVHVAMVVNCSMLLGRRNWNFVLQAYDMSAAVRSGDCC